MCNEYYIMIHLITDKFLFARDLAPTFAHSTHRPRDIILYARAASRNGDTPLISDFIVGLHPNWPKQCKYATVAEVKIPTTMSSKYDFVAQLAITICPLLVHSTFMQIFYALRKMFVYGWLGIVCQNVHI